MADNTVVLSYEIEKRKLDQAVKGTELLGKKIKNIDGAAEHTSKSVDKMADSLRDMTDNSIVKGLQNQVDAIEDEAEATRKLAREVDQLRDSRKQAGKTAEEERTRAVGGVAGGFGAISTAAGTLGLTGVQEIAGGLDDFLTLVERFPEFRESVQTLTTASSAAEAAQVALATSEGAAGTSAAAATPGVAGFGVALNVVLGPLALVSAAVAAVALAVKKFVKDLNEQKAQVDAAIAGTSTYYDLIVSGTEESIAAAQEQIEMEQRARQLEREFLQEQLEQLTLIQRIIAGGKIKKRLEELDQEINENAEQIRAHADAMDNAEVQARSAAEAEDDLAAAQTDVSNTATEAAGAIGEQVEATTELIAEMEESVRMTRRVITAERDRQAAFDEQLARVSENNKKYSDALRQFADDMAKIADDYAQAAVDAQAAFEEAQAQAESELQRELADMDQESRQQRIELLRQSHREEVKATKAHRRNLRQIMKDAEAREKELAIDRDFAGIARLRRDTAQRMEEESKSFEVERKERNIQLKQRLKDQHRQFQLERQQRLKDYRQRLKDNRKALETELSQLATAHQKELDMARTAHQRRLNDVSRSLNAELTMRRKAALSGHQILSEATHAILTMFGKARDALVRMGNSLPGGSSGSTRTVTGRAEGGPLAAFQSAMVNEGFAGQREGFMASGKSVLLPRGMGIFTPFQSGNVVANSRSMGDFNQTIMLPSGINARQAEAIALHMTTKVLGRVFN